MDRGILFVITAPSGCGKGTLRRVLLEELPDIKFCPSITTRPPRPGEVDGVDYIFVSVEEFMERKQGNQLVEWAEVYGNCYGTPKQELEQALEQGCMVLVEKDVQGARTLRQVYPEGIFIFILPPSFEGSNGGLELAGLKMLGNSVSGLKAHAGKLPILLISIMLLSMTT